MQMNFEKPYYLKIRVERSGGFACISSTNERMLITCILSCRNSQKPLKTVEDRLGKSKEVPNRKVPRITLITKLL